MMMHGRIAHGFQFNDPNLKQSPTMYYSKLSGIGKVLTSECGGQKPLRVGVVGLGVGTLAAFGQPNDDFRFYEINPDVIDYANTYFSYLKDSKAEIDVVRGDARLSLETEKDQGFDVLLLDAFSGDSIPVHLLTEEAFVHYKRHLNRDGAIVVNYTNRHLDLVPLLAGMAKRFDYQWKRIVAEGDESIAAAPSK